MKRFAFTMAEILISLTIVGIIAAVTLPALQGNINEKTWATQRKALYSRMTQAISMMPSLNGYGFSDDESVTAEKATLEFITEFGKVMKITNVCDKDHLIDCGIKVGADNKLKINNLKGSQVELNVENLGTYMTTNAVDYPDDDDAEHDYGIEKGGFETPNGESMLVMYNPYCGGNSHDEDTTSSNDMYNKVCATFIYDLNGKNGPNTVGKDIGVVVALYSADSVVVSPKPLQDPVADANDFADATSSCRTTDEDSRLPNLEEAIAMRYNAKLFTDNEFGNTDLFWTNSNVNLDNAWVYYGDGLYKSYDKDSEATAWCIKR